MRPDQRRALERIGSDWGGWTIVAGMLGPGSIVYSAGIGRDATFDLGIIEQYGCVVHAFDPTPIGRAHAEDVAAEHPRFQFHPWGLWKEDGIVAFSVPRDPTYDSFSIVNLARTDASVDCEVRTLSTIMGELGHEWIDLLKIDIEGAEHAVLEHLLSAQVNVKQLCVEFDQPFPLRKIYKLIRRLQRAGFRLVARRKWDHTFVRYSAGA